MLGALINFGFVVHISPVLLHGCLNDYWRTVSSQMTICVTGKCRCQELLAVPPSLHTSQPRETSTTLTRPPTKTWENNHPRFMVNQNYRRVALRTFRIGSGGLLAVVDFVQLVFPTFGATAALLPKGASSVLGKRRPGPATSGLASISSCKDVENCVNHKRY